ncbi:Ropporin-1-like protein [Bienertia sinuspersici]
MPGSRQRPHMKRPVWIIILVSMVCLFLIAAYVYPLRSSAPCSFFPSSGCLTYAEEESTPSRELTDDEIFSRVVVREGHEGRFSVFVHASREKPVHVSRYFLGRDIRSDKVVWGKISMVDAERRLLAHALKDPDNQHFVLLSDSCIPLHNFDYIYNYLLFTNVSFLDCFLDLGPHGTGRYSEHMLPEVEKEDFRKGSQWFTMKRQHALIVMADSLYYKKFKLFCRDVRFLVYLKLASTYWIDPEMTDPGGIANWSVTYVDWSERKWHPRSFRAEDVTFELLRNITFIDKSVHLTSDEKNPRTVTPCMWNGQRRPCYLFARKFYPETLEKLINLFSNYTVV